jgi:bifunctional non-homologous end joining protein LigD
MASLRHRDRRLALVVVPRPDAMGAHWAAPKLVAKVEFTQWTRDGRVRQPAFKGLREDKTAKEIRRATPG